MAASNAPPSATTTSADAKRMVEAGYDEIAARYLEWTRSRPSPRLQHVDKLLKLLPTKGSKVLDLGCGAGVPSTSRLAEQAEVTGVDISTTQIALAKENVPAAKFLKSDMMALEFEAGSFDAVCAFYAVIHLPRNEQRELVSRIAAWLKPGGYMLMNMTAKDEPESVERDWLRGGHDMYWSGFDAESNEEMMKRAGFTLVESEVIAEQEMREVQFLWILAQKQ